MADNSEIAAAGAIATIGGAVLMKGVDVLIKWYNNKQDRKDKETADGKAAARVERTDALTEAYRLIDSYKTRLDEVERQHRTDMEAVNLRLDECRDDHTREMAARGRAETWMFAMQDALRRGGIDFPPFPPPDAGPGSGVHKMLPKQPKEGEGK